MRFSVECAFPYLRKRRATSRKSALWGLTLTEKRILHQRRHRDVTKRRTLDRRRHGEARFACGPHQRAHSACGRWLRREPVFADLCTLLRTHGRSRGRAGPWVPRHRGARGPRDARALGPEVHAAGAVTQPSTHTNSRSLIIQGLACRRGRRERVPCGMIAAGKGRSSHQLERSSRGAGEASRTSRHPARGSARGTRGSRGGRQCH